MGVLDGKEAISDEEMAGLIAYLCSPIAEYIPGQSINIDGGVVMWQVWHGMAHVSGKESRNGCHPVWTDWHGQAWHALCPASHA